MCACGRMFRIPIYLGIYLSYNDEEASQNVCGIFLNRVFNCFSNLPEKNGSIPMREKNDSNKPNDKKEKANDMEMGDTDGHHHVTHPTS